MEVRLNPLNDGVGLLSGVAMSQHSESATAGIEFDDVVIHLSVR